MKNTQKKFLSAVLAASSVAGVVAPAVTAFAQTTTEVETLVANALKDKTFYSFNVAYGAIVTLPADQQGKYLDQIAPLGDVVRPKGGSVDVAMLAIDEFYKTQDMATYNKTLLELIPKIENATDRTYVNDELGKWGMIFIADKQKDYIAATDAINKVNTALAAGKLDEAQALVKDAQAAIDKVAHANNKKYLTEVTLPEVVTRLNEKVGVAVKSVTANSAKSFVVKFNRAVTDADKITFDVTRLSTAVPVTVTWNTDKTEATLTSASNFAEATFAVSVKKDTKEIAKENVTISAQKVAKIEFTSKSVAVTLGGAPVGYVTFKAYDQYNTDITSSYLANSVRFQSGVQNGDLTVKNGLITIDNPANGISLLALQNISIVAFDNNAGLSTTVTLPVTTASGTLSSFALGSTDNVKLVDGDITSVFYIPYTAKDLSGNDTKNFDLINSGLIGDKITTSSTNVQATLVHDPADYRNAAIEVKVINANSNPIPMDMPVTITAMTFNGASSVNTTLTMAKKISTITLLAPAEVVALNESPALGYEAYDQFGNKLTKYSDIIGDGTKVNFSNNVGYDKNADGTLKLFLKATSTSAKGTQTVTATVQGTAKMSTININVQDAAKPARVAVDSSKIVTAMEDGSNQKFGMDGKGVKLYDQYDREMNGDKINAALLNGTNYTVKISNTNSSVDVSAQGTDFKYLNSNTSTSIYAGAVNGGSDTIKVELIDVANSTPTYTKVLSTGSVSVAVIKTEDIVDYTISDLSSTTIYAASTTSTSITAAAQEYKANPTVYGKTNSGAKVLLAGNVITGTSLTNTNDFVATTTAGAFDAVKVVAIKPADLTKTEASTEVTVTVKHNGKVTPLKTQFKSSTVAPVAVDALSSGVKDDVEEITVANLASLNGKYVVKFDKNGAKTADLTAGNTADYFFFKIKDSYGKEAMAFTQFEVTDATRAGVYNVTNDGILTISGAVQDGDSFVITAITNNGLSKKIKVVVKNPSITASADNLTLTFN